jgi:ribosomal protein S15P/S13E
MSNVDGTGVSGRDERQDISIRISISHELYLCQAKPSPVVSARPAAVALLTSKIFALAEHLKDHKKDHSSRRCVGWGGFFSRPCLLALSPITGVVLVVA